MHKKESVLFVIEELTCGGAEKVTTILATELTESYGMDVTLCVLKDGAINYKISEKVNTIIVGQKGCTKFIRIIHEFFGLKRIIRDTAPDVVVSLATYRTCIILQVVSMARNYRLYFSERSDPRRFPDSRFKRLLRDAAYSLCDGVIFQTEYARDSFGESTRSKSRVIRNPIYLPEEGVVKEKRDKRIVSCSRLVPEKNISLLIEAFKDVSESFPDYSLHIYGDGALRKELEQSYMELIMNQKLFFHGHVTNIINAINGAGIYVCTSDYEGMSNSLLEAMSLGIPIICTDCSPGNMRLILKNGECGVLVPPKDKQSLVNAIKELINNPKKAEVLGKRARLESRVYDHTPVVKEWMDYLKG